MKMRKSFFSTTIFFVSIITSGIFTQVEARSEHIPPKGSRSFIATVKNISDQNVSVSFRPRVYEKKHTGVERGELRGKSALLDTRIRTPQKKIQVTLSVSEEALSSFSVGQRVRLSGVYNEKTQTITPLEIVPLLDRDEKKDRKDDNNIKTATENKGRVQE